MIKLAGVKPRTEAWDPDVTWGRYTEAVVPKKVLYDSRTGTLCMWQAWPLFLVGSEHGTLRPRTLTPD